MLKMCFHRTFKTNGVSRVVKEQRDHGTRQC